MKEVEDSNSDDGGTGDVDWILYRNRPEWSDVQPVPQCDTAYPVVQIAYSEKFADIFDYFRAVLLKNELSERAFELTKDAAAVNPSNYTVWHYRRTLLKTLMKDLYKELNYIQEVIEDNPKNYQVWHHRQVLVDWLKDGSQEKRLTEKILSVDAKNYHAWQHRQWAIQLFNLWDGELEYINRLLEEDVRNNSAWNQRYFIIKNASQFTDETLEREIKYTLDSIEKVPHNESSWNYLRGILMEKGLANFPNVIEYVERLYNEGCKSPYLLAFIIDYITEKLQAEANDDLYLRAVELCNSLAKEHDTIRKAYWNYIARSLENKYGLEQAHSQHELDGEDKDTES